MDVGPPESCVTKHTISESKQQKEILFLILNPVIYEWGGLTSIPFSEHNSCATQNSDDTNQGQGTACSWQSVYGEILCRLTAVMCAPDCLACHRLPSIQQTAMLTTDCFALTDCHACNRLPGEQLPCIQQNAMHTTDCLAIWHTDMTCIQQTAMDINRQPCVWLTGTHTADYCICNILPYTWHTTVPDTQQTAQHVACCHACDRLLWVWQIVWHKTGVSCI